MENITTNNECQELKNIMYKTKFFNEDSPSAIAAAAARRPRGS